MNYLLKCTKLINNYMIAFIVNTIFFIIAVSLNINKNVLIFSSILIAIASIVIYKLFKKNDKYNNLSFHIVTIAVSCCISAVYTNSNYEFISIPTIIGLLLIIEAFYLVMKMLINKFNLYKISIFISLILGVILVISVILLRQFNSNTFDSLFWLVTFYSIIFFMSFISVIFLKKDTNFELVLMLSYCSIFVIIFVLAISIISEDGSILELFYPDWYEDKKNRKLNKN